MKEITVPAVIENVAKVTAFVDEFLEANDCPMKAMMQIDIAIDELFSNVAYYAYNEGNGDITIKVCILDNPKRVSLSFIDNGKMYNPLEREDPDTHLSAEERGIGGLGIFIVKKSMDNVFYEYKDSQNILTIEKYL